jgi:DNA-binding LytR/AlgR family response regulator
VAKDNARVHVIPVDRLDYVEAQDDYDPERFVRIRMAILSGGTQLPVSRAGYDRLKALLEDRR